MKKSQNNYPPLLYTLKKRGLVLFYFGARHSYNPSDKQFITLEKFWNKFIRITGGKNCIVLVEGGKRPVLENKGAAIIAGGEAHFITLLASKNNVQTLTPEPDLNEERSVLLRKFKKNEIQYYYFARTVDQWNRRGCTPTLSKYIKPFLLKDKLSSGWKNFDFSLQNMKKIHRSIFHTKFNEFDGMFFRSVTNPTKRDFSKINRVAIQSATVRNTNILKNIKSLWNKNNVFVVYGRSHAINHRPVLEKFSSIKK
jgi:hypothetical protein